MYVPLNDCHPDPGVSLGPLPGLAPARILAEEEAGSDRRGFALPVLVRERNRLIEAVDEALLVGGSLKEELGRQFCGRPTGPARQVPGSRCDRIRGRG